jgi:hypothetical protein
VVLVSSRPCSSKRFSVPATGAAWAGEAAPTQGDRRWSRRDRSRRAPLPTS